MSEGRERGPLDFDDEPPRRSRLVGERPADVPAQPPPGARGPMGTRYLWVVGAGAVVLVLILLVATLRHGTERGARGVPDGRVMPAFAVPTAVGALQGDANIAQHAGEGEAGHEPACTVQGKDIMNICALRSGAPVVLAFFTIKSKDCVAQLDVMEQVQQDLPAVRFAAVAIRGDRDDLRAMVRRHGWTFPVGYDRDGALANTYHVQVCPQLTFARRGGRVAETTFGRLGPGDLAAKARRLTTS
jgi:hypothetical protein